MVYGLKAVIGHRRLLWVNACIYLVDMMVLGKWMISTFSISLLNNGPWLTYLACLFPHLETLMSCWLIATQFTYLEAVQETLGQTFISLKSMKIYGLLFKTSSQLTIKHQALASVMQAKFSKTICTYLGGMMESRDWMISTTLFYQKRELKSTCLYPLYLLIWSLGLAIRLFQM
jgi:hypothetical protein